MDIDVCQVIKNAEGNDNCFYEAQDILLNREINGTRTIFADAEVDNKRYVVKIEIIETN